MHNTNKNTAYKGFLPVGPSAVCTMGNCTNQTTKCQSIFAFECWNGMVVHHLANGSWPYYNVSNHAVLASKMISEVFIIKAKQRVVTIKEILKSSVLNFILVSRLYNVYTYIFVRASDISVASMGNSSILCNLVSRYPWNIPVLFFPNSKWARLKPSLWKLSDCNNPFLYFFFRIKFPHNFIISVFTVQKSIHAKLSLFFL